MAIVKTDHAAGAPYPKQRLMFMPKQVGFLFELHCVSESRVAVLQCYGTDHGNGIARNIYAPYPSVHHWVLHRHLGEPAPSSNDAQLPRQMNGAVSWARLGINLWPLLGYYFAPSWGTIVLMARPRKPQFSWGSVSSRSSNPSPSRGGSCKPSVPQRWSPRRLKDVDALGR